MDLIYTDEQAEYRDQVRRFADRVLQPITEDYDFSRVLGREEIEEMRARISKHEIATSAPLLDDGRLDQIGFGIFIEEISRINVAFVSLASALFFQVWDMIDLLDDAQRVTYGYMFEPGKMVSLGLSEPDAGSNPRQMETVARRKDNGFVLSGRKMWTSHAEVSVGLMIVARKVDEGDEGVGLYLMSTDQEGCEIRGIETMGWEATSRCMVFLDDCWVPADAEIRLGPGGLRGALSLVEQGRTKINYMAVGLAQASLELATEYAKLRTQFGKPIASFQLVQEMLAEMATLTEAMRLMAHRASSLSMARSPQARAALSMAKAFTSETAGRVTSLGIQVHGGIGLTTECKAERYFRDARMLTIPDGTTQIHNLIIGRELTGIGAFR